MYERNWILGRLEVAGYRSLREVDVRVPADFAMVFGRTAAGKSGLFDALRFLRDCVLAGVHGAVEGDRHHGIARRARSARELSWCNRIDGFSIRASFAETDGTPGPVYALRVRTAAVPLIVGEELALPDGQGGHRIVLSRVRENPETVRVNGTEETVATDRCAVSAVDEPEVAEFRSWLTGRIVDVGVDHGEPGRPTARDEAGFPNLPWAVHDLRMDGERRYREWLGHVREVLPDVKDIAAHQRPEDGRRYLSVEWECGTVTPGWCLSNGALKFLALCILPQLDPKGILLVEHPEAGLDLRTADHVWASLRSCYSAQVLATTTAIVFPKGTTPDEILCVTKREDGSTEVVPGNEHPYLSSWSGGVELGDFANTVVL